MKILHESCLWALLDSVVGTVRTVRLFEALEVHEDLLRPRGDRVSRVELSQALTMLLFEDVVRRVPMAAAYVGDAVRQGRKLVFDHGALRTVAAPDCGALPSGHDAFRRILEPLGFEERDVYPLEKLGMTGRAFAHKDMPADVAQFFVSELHPECFTDTFQHAVLRTVKSSRDPLPLSAKGRLGELEKNGDLSFADAQSLLPNLVGCFDRQHQEPTWADYEAMRRESKEMAWIATEGNAFNHATDRVADVYAVADRQKELGRPMKERVEVSASGRVRQTAFRAAEVERLFVSDDGALITERVPGSFHEFISRDEEQPGVLDLRFDSSNATGIFKMTSKPQAPAGKIDA
ncbi:MAG: DUF1338 domain-containing protein [Planctomycetota bacterium]